MTGSRATLLSGITARTAAPLLAEPHRLAGALLAVPREGGAAAPILTGIEGIGAVAADATHVLFASSSRVSALEKATRTVRPLAAAQAGPVAVAVDAAYVYWACDTGVRRIARQGGATSTLAAAAGGRVSALAIDGGRVYFADVVGGTISRVASRGGGGRAEVVAAGQRRPNALVVDDHFVFWSLDDDAGAIVRARK